MLPMGIAFGIAHAMTPGHSKAVLASYVAGSGITLRKAIASSLLLSFVHIASAVLLSTVAGFLITRTLVGAGQVPLLEWTSRVSLMLIGLWMVIRPFTRRPHMHGEAQGFAFMAGLIPCPLTLFIMMLATSKGVPEAGIAFAIAMFAGVSAVLSAVALLAAFARAALNTVLQSHGRHLDVAARAIEVFCGVVLLALAAYQLM